MDEERFRNRFAGKKISKEYQVNAEHTDPTREQLSNNKGSNMNALLEKIDILQKDVEDLKKMHDENQLSNYEESKNEPRMIDQATRRINELEDAVRAMNNFQNSKTSDETVKFSNHQETKDINTCRTEFLPNLEEDASIREQIKKAEKERYAKELKQQIEEKQRLKEQQQQREREEDMIRQAKTRDYDSLGHIIRDRPKEPLLKNPNVPDRGLESYARGGNGIFGAPLTPSQKIANENYRKELMLQIEEKRLQEERRLQEEKELELKELKKVKDEVASIEPAPEPQISVPPEPSPVVSPEKNRIRKQSACVQVALERRLSRQKAKKIVRKPIPKEKIQKIPKYEELLSQISQLKIELAAEKLRMARDNPETLDVIHIYDPRSVPEDSITPHTLCVNRNLKRPIKVHRVLAAPVYPIGNKSTLDQQVTLSSSSLFLPQTRQAIPRSPSVGSLNLEEINRQMKRRFEQLGASEEIDDLYKNEEPIIREFMAEEEAKLISNSECY
ncbi:hypothetical protein Aperf_G00000077987 [Anoplocephala perfoliata]